MGEKDSDRPAGPPLARPAGLTAPVSNTKAIVAMLAATAIFTCGDAAMKLASARLPTSQTIFMRGGLSMLVLLLVAIGTGAIAGYRRALVPAMAWRSIGDVGGAVFFQSALARMKFADLMGIMQLNPLSLTAASALFLGEPVRWRRWAAVAVGFCGALLVIKPGSSAFTWWALLGLLCVFSGTLRDVSTRKLDPGLSPLLILLISQSAVTLAGLTMGLFDTWVAPSPANLLHILVASACSMAGHLCVIVSVRSGQLSAVAPFRYTSIVWAILIGYGIWGELPDMLSFAGILILISAGLYTLYREQVVRRERARERAQGQP